MITFEQEKKREESILRRMDPRPLKDRHKGVLRIIGEVKKSYGSGKPKDDSLDITREKSCDAAIIRCDNTECTCGCVDLNNIIDSMISERKTLQEGIEFCTGRDGHAYSYQCRTIVKYKITIIYE